MRTYLSFLLTLGVVGALPLAGQTTLGLTGAVVGPVGDLDRMVGHQSGITAGLTLSIGLGQGWVLRPRADYLYFPKHSEVTAVGSSGQETDFYTSDSVSSTSVGLDGQYFFAGRPQGLYCLAGISSQAWRDKRAVQTITVANGQVAVTSETLSSTWKHVGYSAGVGWQFNRHIAVEARYTLSQMGGLAANSLQLAAHVQF